MVVGNIKIFTIIQHIKFQNTRHEYSDDEIRKLKAIELPHLDNKK